MIVQESSHLVAEGASLVLIEHNVFREQFGPRRRRLSLGRRRGGEREGEGQGSGDAKGDGLRGEDRRRGWRQGSLGAVRSSAVAGEGGDGGAEEDGRGGEEGGSPSSDHRHLRAFDQLRFALLIKTLKA